MEMTKAIVRMGRDAVERSKKFAEAFGGSVYYTELQGDGMSDLIDILLMDLNVDSNDHTRSLAIELFEGHIELSEFIAEVR